MDWYSTLIMIFLMVGIISTYAACESWGFASKRKKYFRKEKDKISTIKNEKLTQRSIEKKLELSYLLFLIGLSLISGTIWIIYVADLEAIPPIIGVDIFIAIVFISAIIAGISNGVKECRQLVENEPITKSLN